MMRDSSAIRKKKAEKTSGVRYGITGYFSAALEVPSMAHQELKRHPCRSSRISCYPISTSRGVNFQNGKGLKNFKPSSLPQKQQGVALITVLLVFALVAIIGAAIIRQLDLSIQATTHHVHSAMLRQYALGTEEYVKILLAEDLKSDKEDGKEIDYLGEIWAQPRCLKVNDSGIATPKIEDEKEKQKRQEKEDNDKKDKDPIECENGILMEIKDAQGYFNINNLYVDKVKTKDDKDNDQEDVYVDSNDLTKVFTNYRNNIEKELSKKIPQDLTTEIGKWISQKSKDGSEDLEYLSLKPPYRVARQPLQHISELQLVRYIRDKSNSYYLPLAENLVALPEPSKPGNKPIPINILTAPEELIKAVCKAATEKKRELGQSDLEQFLKERVKDKYKDISEVKKTLASCGEGKKDIEYLSAKKLVSVSSQYFIAQFTVRLNDYETILTSYFYRESQDKVTVYKRRWLPEPIFTKETS